jgi:hypothetical protein
MGRTSEQILFHFDAFDQHLTVHKQPPTIEEWLADGATLQTFDRSVQWWLGDWLIAGETWFGEAYAQGVDEVNADTMKKYQWVSSRVDRARRVAVLSWSHHREVADLEPKQQTTWLARAVTKGWSANDLRRDLAAFKGGPKVTSLWLVVSCTSVADQNKLAKQMLADGRQVKVTVRKRAKPKPKKKAKKKPAGPVQVAQVKTRRGVKLSDG